MTRKISKRLLEIIDSLPLENGIRILEIGCGPGAAAREIASRFNKIYVLGLDRSQKAIDQAEERSQPQINSGKLKFIKGKIEDFNLPAGETKFDIAFAIRVGALDGRYPNIEEESIRRITKALKKNGKLFIDGGNPLKEIKLQY